MIMIKKVVGIGNGAAVYVPKKYINQELTIILPEDEQEIKRKILSKVEKFMEDILGIYLVGSYARREERVRSDVDVLVITNRTNKRIKEENYDILLISLDIVKKQLEKNILPLLPMIMEARIIMNPKLIEEFKGVRLNKKNLGFHFETTKSAGKVIGEALNMCKKSCSDNLAYSLVLRLREAYIVDCLIKNRKWSTKELIEIIKEVSNGVSAYFGYLRAKNKEKDKNKLKVEEARELLRFIKKKIKEQEEWAGKRR